MTLLTYIVITIYETKEIPLLIKETCGGSNGRTPFNNKTITIKIAPALNSNFDASKWASFQHSLFFIDSAVRNPLMLVILLYAFFL